MSNDISMVIPDPAAAPKEGSLPDHFPKRNNLAGDETLAADVLKYLSGELETFKGQNARQQMITNTAGTMDTADRAWRVALRRNTSSAQYQNSLSDVASSVFHRSIRALTSGENAVFFQGSELPARYEVDLNTSDYTPADGMMVAEQRNLLRDYTWERDQRRIKIKKGNLFKNKYGHQLWAIEWVHEVAEKLVKIKDPKSGKITRKKKKFVVKQHPCLSMRNLRNFYADAYIEEMDAQRTTLEWRELPYEVLAQDQAMGFIKNLSKITAKQASDGSVDDLTYNERTNAGETPETHQTRLLSVWEGWAYLPIKESKTNGRGKIDKKVMPELYWCTYVGGTYDTMDGAVCVRMIKNPYNHGKRPYFMDYAYHDDKGFYHVAPINLVESAYWQVVTNINQAIDNVTLRNRAPYTLDGPLLSRDSTFLANKMIRIGKGTTLKPIEVPQTTQITMEMYRAMEAEVLKTLGITQTIEGMPLGGRTSASEAENDLDQAMKPLLQKADENGQAFYEWLMNMDAELWDQFADPDMKVTLTHMGDIRDIVPAEMYGPIKVKVTAVTEFENKATRRRELNGFLQSGGYDRAAEVMPPEGKSLFWRQVGDEFGFRRVNEMFPPMGDRDSMRRAAQESWDMLNDGKFVAAEQGENHAAHLRQHESWLREYLLLPEQDMDPARGQMLQLHIEQHKGFQVDVSQRQAPALQEGTTGELNANPMEAAAGAGANLG